MAKRSVLEGIPRKTVTAPGKRGRNVSIIIVQKAHEAALKVLDALKATMGQEAALQDTKEQLGLVEPRAVLWCEMKDMTVAWVAQKRPALHTFFELVRFKGHLAPASDQATDVQAPVGIQVVHDPVVTLHAG
jgi:hypothetical protein